VVLASTTSPKAEAGWGEMALALIAISDFSRVAAAKVGNKR
jgi:hypothetical protein